MNTVVMSKIGLAYVVLYAAALLGVVVTSSNAPLKLLLLPWSLGMENIENQAMLLPFVILNGLAIYAVTACFDVRYQKQIREAYSIG